MDADMQELKASLGPVVPMLAYLYTELRSYENRCH